MTDAIDGITPASTTEVPTNPMTPTAYVPQGSAGSTVVDLEASPPQVKEQSGKAKRPSTESLELHLKPWSWVP
ncbi:hypothetical protein MKW92_036659 [Papaver armeniacum]|nr:hypothetical protein MKW92_036659 [Papaver armeniacum]